MSANSAKVIFMGSDEIAIPVLEVLFADPTVELSAIYTQPDRPSGRGKKLRPNAIKTWGLENKIPIQQPEKIDAETETKIIDQQPVMVIVMAYGHILKKTLLDAIPLGVWNFHTSLLPKFRGASPIQSAIAAGEKISGVTLMRIEPRMDAGAVVAQKETPIQPDETGASLYQTLSKLSGDLMSDQLETLLSGNVSLTPQNEGQATYCHKLTKKDGAIDFKQNAQEIENRIRAFQPWPGAYCEYKTENENFLLKVGSAKVEKNDSSRNNKAGTILSADTKGVLVQCGDGLLHIISMQRPGGKMLPMSDFLNGFHLQEGKSFLLP